jgi:hypothetical protein
MITFVRINIIYEIYLSIIAYRSFLYPIYSFFFQEKMLGDISFKLETKINNVFFENNIIKSTQVLSIICNVIYLQFSQKKKEYIGYKKLRYAILLSKYDSAEKRYLNYASVLKN